MRKTIIAASAAALLALSACGTDDGGVNVDGATEAVSTEVDNLMNGDKESGNAESGEKDKAGEDKAGEDKAGENGAEGGNAEQGTIALPDGSEVEAPAGIAQKYEEIQAADGHLGAPVGEAQAVAGGQMLEFEGGTLVQNPDGEAFLVQGVILEEYTANGGPEGELGFPTTDETPNETGFISTFDKGEITFDSATQQATVQQN